MLGPTIRGEVGDLIKVTFMNKATKNYNMYTHGAFYDSGEQIMDYYPLFTHLFSSIYYLSHSLRICKCLPS